jgi:hypothetical protein
MIKWMGQNFFFNFTMSDNSCIQCNSIVRMIRIFSGTDMIKKVPIYLYKVPICLGTEMSHTGAEVSRIWVKQLETNCKHKKIIYKQVYLTACVLWSPAISCDGCEIYLWIEMTIVNQMSILKWSVMPEKKYSNIYLCSFFIPLI